MMFSWQLFARAGLEEREELSRALLGIREVLASIDAQIEERDKHEQLLEIYQKVDGKSSGLLDEKPFKVGRAVPSSVYNEPSLI